MQLSKQLLTTLAVAGSVLLVGGHSAHALSPNSSQPRTDMVDLSSWQSNLGASDYQKLHDAGVKAVAIKASEGTSYTSPVLQQQSSAAQNAGLAVNYYHFAHFTSVASAQAEAQNFIKSVQSVTSSKNMVLVVDFEASELGRQSKATNDADLAAFDSTLNAAGYNKTDLYTMASWLGSRIDTNDSNKGWIAQWPSNPTGTEYPSANAWQWASDYRFNGESQNLDVSQLNNDFYVNGDANAAVHTSSGSSTPKTTLVKVQHQRLSRQPQRQPRRHRQPRAHHITTRQPAPIQLSSYGVLQCTATPTGPFPVPVILSTWASNTRT